MFLIKAEHGQQIARMSTVSNLTKQYWPAFMGVAVLAGLFLLFSPPKPELAERRDQSERRRGDERDLPQRDGSKNTPIAEGQPDRETAIPGEISKVAPAWSSASLEVLEYLRQNTEPDRYDEGHFTKLILGALPTLSANERVRLMQETGRWFAIHAEDRAIGLLNNLQTVGDRSQFASGVVRDMLAADPYRAIEWVTAVSDDYIAANLHNQIARTWARSDLSGAMQWVQKLPEDRYQAEAIEGIVFTWTQQDIDAAYKWILEMDHDEIQNRALSMMVKVISGTDPESAAKWAVQLPESSQASEALSYAVQAWAREDVEASAIWLMSLEDPKNLETVFRAVPMGWSNSEPAAAANWVMAWEGVEQQPNVLRSVVSKWGSSDPAAAIDWLEQFPGDDIALRDSMVKELFEKVATKKPSEAKTLMQTLGSDELKMIASQAINMALTPDDETP
jgi:hypothetical protein